jgi:hypothetical protein
MTLMLRVIADEVPDCALRASAAGACIPHVAAVPGNAKISTLKTT